MECAVGHNKAFIFCPNVCLNEGCVVCLSLAILIPKWESIYYFCLTPPSHHILYIFFESFLFPFLQYMCSFVLLWILVLPLWDVLDLESLLLPFSGFDITSTGYFLFFNPNLVCLANMFWETLVFSGLRLYLYITVCICGNSKLYVYTMCCVWRDCFVYVSNNIW